jgi:hypothetical protein
VAPFRTVGKPVPNSVLEALAMGRRWSLTPQTLVISSSVSGPACASQPRSRISAAPTATSARTTPCYRPAAGRVPSVTSVWTRSSGIIPSCTTRLAPLGLALRRRARE